MWDRSQLSDINGRGIEFGRQHMTGCGIGLDCDKIAAYGNEKKNWRQNRIRFRKINRIWNRIRFETNEQDVVSNSIETNKLYKESDGKRYKQNVELNSNESKKLDVEFGTGIKNNTGTRRGIEYEREQRTEFGWRYMKRQYELYVIHFA